MCTWVIHVYELLCSAVDKSVAYNPAPQSAGLQPTVPGDRTNFCVYTVNSDHPLVE